MVLTSVARPGRRHGGRGYLAALRVPLVRRLVGATTASVVGDYLGVGALLVMAADRTGGSAVGAAGGLRRRRADDRPRRHRRRAACSTGVPRVRALVTLELLGAALICLPLLARRRRHRVHHRRAARRTAHGDRRDPPGRDRRGVSRPATAPALIALGNTIDQGAQVLGYWTGAAHLPAVSPSAALLLDAAQLRGRRAGPVRHPPPRRGAGDRGTRRRRAHRHDPDAPRHGRRCARHERPPRGRTTSGAIRSYGCSRSWCS